MTEITIEIVNICTTMFTLKSVSKFLMKNPNISIYIFDDTSKTFQLFVSNKKYNIPWSHSKPRRNKTLVQG